MKQVLVEIPTLLFGKHRFSPEMQKLEWNLSWGLVLDGGEAGIYKHL